MIPHFILFYIILTYAYILHINYKNLKPQILSWIFREDTNDIFEWDKMRHSKKILYIYIYIYTYIHVHTYTYIASTIFMKDFIVTAAKFVHVPLTSRIEFVILRVFQICEFCIHVGNISNLYILDYIYIWEGSRKKENIYLTSAKKKTLQKGLIIF